MKRSICVFLLFFAAQFFAALFALGWELLSSETDIVTAMTEPPPVVLGISIAVAELLLIVILLRWFSQPHALRCFRGGIDSKGLLALLGFIVMAQGLSILLTPFDLNDMGVEADFMVMKDNWLCLLALCVVAPMAEELVFREGILREMMAAGARPWSAVVASAVAFGAVHGDPAQMVPAVIMGLALGWMYYKTGNIRLCLPAHILNNSVSCFEMNFPEIDSFIESLSPLVTLSVGVVIFAAGVCLLYKPLCK